MNMGLVMANLWYSVLALVLLSALYAYTPCAVAARRPTVSIRERAASKSDNSIPNREPL